MQEKSILVDSLETLKHAAERYQEAAFECDSDNVREIVQDIMYDRCEQQNAVFNLMHQMGLYETEVAPKEQLQKLIAKYRSGLEQLQSH